MGHKFSAALSLNNTSSGRSLYCGSPSERGRREAEGCSSSDGLCGWSYRASLWQRELSAWPSCGISVPSDRRKKFSPACGSTLFLQPWWYYVYLKEYQTESNFHYCKLITSRNERPKFCCALASPPPKVNSCLFFFFFLNLLLCFFKDWNLLHHNVFQFS